MHNLFFLYARSVFHNFFYENSLPKHFDAFFCPQIVPLSLLLYPVEVVIIILENGHGDSSSNSVTNLFAFHFTLIPYDKT